MARKEFEHLRAQILAMHDEEQPPNEADIVLAEVEKMAAFVPTDPVRSPKAAERYVEAVQSIPTVIERAKAATAGVRQAKANAHAAELAEAKAEAESCITVFRSQVKQLVAKNMKMGAPYDEATQAIDVAQATVLMAEKLQSQAGTHDASAEIVQKFVDATTKARDAVDAAAVALQDREEAVERKREEAMAKEKSTKLATDVAVREAP